MGPAFLNVRLRLMVTKEAYTVIEIETLPANISL